jgi:hypothetical protein
MTTLGVLAGSKLSFPLHYLLGNKISLFFWVVFFIKIILDYPSIELGKIKILFNHFTSNLTYWMNLSRIRSELKILSKIADNL